MRKVEVVPYTEEWQECFNKERNRLREILDDSGAVIHHIGSTSIRGLAAKPIVDIVIEVLSLKNIDQNLEAFEQNGYVAKGENGIPNRRYFYREERPNVRVAHIHIFEKGDPEVFRHVAFRDYLNAHEEEAKRYGDLKIELSKQYPYDIESYINGKAQLVKELERRALAWYKKNSL